MSDHAQTRLPPPVILEREDRIQTLHESLDDFSRATLYLLLRRDGWNEQRAHNQRVMAGASAW